MSRSGYSRADRKADTDSALIDAARHCIGEHGPEVSIHDVAHEAGIAVGTIYNYYESKGDLFAATGVRTFAEFSAWAQPSLARIDDPAMRLATFGRYMTRMPETHPEYALVIWHTQRYVWGPRYRASEEGELERDVREGIKRGRFDSHLIHAKVVVTIGAILHFLGLRILHPRTPAGEGDDVIELVLTTLGLPGDEAHRLSHCRLARRPPVR